MRIRIKTLDKRKARVSGSRRTLTASLSFLYSILTPVFVSILLQGCFDKSTILPSGAQAITSSNTSTAINLDGTRIQLNWSPSKSTSLAGYQIYEILLDGTLKFLAQTPKTSKSYLVTGLKVGTFHSYIIRVKYSDGSNDGNTNALSAITYSGITSTSSLTTNSARVQFPAATDASAINIYCSTRGLGYVLMSSASNSATQQALTGLKSGTTYTCKALAVAPTGVEDQNILTIKFQTVSISSVGYQGPLLIQAYGPAPAAPSGTPQQAQVSITWNPFTTASSNTNQYALVRTAQGAVLDMTTSQSCTSTTLTSCLVCNSSGIGPQTCLDSQVASSPQIYDYAVTLVNQGWVEELPSSSDIPYRINVPIPPSNMVLVQRDAVNYETCQTMGLPSDPFNHQRCSYGGLGAVPYNTGPGNNPLGLDAAHYDFGYNLFVDRWNAGCNWTKGPTVCSGTGVSANGDCYGSGDPTSGTTITAPVGTVYYDYNNGGCYVNADGNSLWYCANNTNTPTSLLSLFYTNSPRLTDKVPPLTQLQQSQAYQACQGSVDPNYGPKRLPRLREMVASSASSWISGEPNSMSDSQITRMDGGLGNSTSHKFPNYTCNGDAANGIALATFDTSGYELARSASGGPNSFVLGSLATSRCISRYGVQDYAGNVWEYGSDNLATCDGGSPHTCTGGSSIYDSGNIDLSNFRFDGVQGPGGAGTGAITSWNINNSNYNTFYFSVPLGLPLVGNDNGFAVSLTGTTNFPVSRLHTNAYWLGTDSFAGQQRPLIYGGSWYEGTNGGRFASNWWNWIGLYGNNVGFRCVLPASQ